MITHRLGSATVLLTAIGLSVFWNSPIAKVIFCLLGLAFVLVGLTEFFNMSGKLGAAGFKRLTLFASACFILSKELQSPYVSEILNLDIATWKLQELSLSILVIFGFLAVFRSEDYKKGVMNLIASFAGFLYVCWPLSFLMDIYLWPSDDPMFGPSLMLYLILSTKMGDVGGYTVGMLTHKIIGKNHKMVPRLSPGKSWEGFCGSLIFSMITSIILMKIYNGFEINGSPLISITAAVIIGLILGAVGLMGDLAESVLKRSSGVKDSGKILPGMGGFLDVLDSLILVSPVFYAYLFFLI